MSDYIRARTSQIYLYKDVPLYYKNKDNSYLLYKKSGVLLDPPRVNKENHPDLFLKKDDQAVAEKELFASLNRHLAEQFLSNDLSAVRNSLNLIIREAMDRPESPAISVLPETIELLFDGFAHQAEFFDTLIKMKAAADILTEHTVNVMLLTFRFGFFHELDPEEIKRLALCALFHDVGVCNIDPGILNAKRRLTDNEFEEFTTHTSKGCDLLLKHPGFDPLVATVAQEHHERIDGSGYPHGRTNVSKQSQIIGLIDSYESLTYTSRSHRKAKKPFDSLTLIKNEVLEGKFDSKVFKRFSTCLTQKN